MNQQVISSWMQWESFPDTNHIYTRAYIYIYTVCIYVYICSEKPPGWIFDFEMFLVYPVYPWHIQKKSSKPAIQNLPSPTLFIDRFCTWENCVACARIGFPVSIQMQSLGDPNGSYPPQNQQIPFPKMMLFSFSQRMLICQLPPLLGYFSILNLAISLSRWWTINLLKLLKINGWNMSIIGGFSFRWHFPFWIHGAHGCRFQPAKKSSRVLNPESQHFTAPGGRIRSEGNGTLNAELRGALDAEVTLDLPVQARHGACVCVCAGDS